MCPWRWHDASAAAAAAAAVGQLRQAKSAISPIECIQVHSIASGVCFPQTTAHGAHKRGVCSAAARRPSRGQCHAPCGGERLVQQTNRRQRHADRSPEAASPPAALHPPSPCWLPVCGAFSVVLQLPLITRQLFQNCKMQERHHNHIARDQTCLQAALATPRTTLPQPAPHRPAGFDGLGGRCP